MHNLIRYISLLFLLFITFKLGVKIPNVIGGSVILTLICGIFLCASVKYKEYQYQLSLILLLSVLIIVFNFLSYTLEVYNITFWPLTIYMMIWVVSFYFFIFHLIYTLLPEYNLISDENTIKDELRTKIIQIIAYFTFNSAVYYIFTCIIMTPNYKIVTLVVNDNIEITLFHLLLIWINIPLLLSLIYLRKINTFLNKTQLPGKLFQRKSKFHFVIAALLILSFGSILEIVRDDWILWVESFFLVIILTVILWKITAYSVAITRLNVEKLVAINESIPTLNRMKFNVYNIVLLVIYVSLLIYLVT